MMFGGLFSEAEHQLENAVMMLMENAMNRKLRCITEPFIIGYAESFGGEFIRLVEHGDHAKATVETVHPTESRFSSENKRSKAEGRIESLRPL